MKYPKMSDDPTHQKLRSFTTILLAAPRVLAPIGALAATAAVLSACVPAMKYEEAVSASEVEAEGRRRAEVELATSKGRVKELEAELKARDQKLEVRDQKLAEAGLEHGILAKERDETSLVLDQLRSDLSRANDNMRLYAANNQRLERELSSAHADSIPPAAAAAPPPVPPAAAPPSAAASAADVAALVQSVETAFAAAQLNDRVKLTRRSDGVVLSIPEKTLFASGSANPNPEVLRALDAAAHWLEARPALACRLREVGSAASVSESLGRERREKLVRAIEERKLGQRIVYQPSADVVAAEAYDLTFVLPGAGVPVPTKALTPTSSSAPPRLEPPSGS